MVAVANPDLSTAFVAAFARISRLFMLGPRDMPNVPGGMIPGNADY
jgi:hypothetical protein